MNYPNTHFKRALEMLTFLGNKIQLSKKTKNKKCHETLDMINSVFTSIALYIIDLPIAILTMASAHSHSNHGIYL